MKLALIAPKFKLNAAIYMILLVLVFTVAIRLSSRLLVENSDATQYAIFLAENPPIRDDAKILWYLHEYHLTPPSRKPYKLHPNRPGYGGHLKQPSLLFRDKTNGFFIEAGANDGEFYSNTLDLELTKNWTGLLIEPNPFLVPALRMTNRRAWIADVCLSTNGYPGKIRFRHDSRAMTSVWNQGGGFIENSDFNPEKAGRDPEIYIFGGGVDCFPLETLLRAINQSVVDYFCLDIEGVEFKILNAFPFDKIKIKVLSIEHNLIPEGYDALKKLLIANNFKIVFKDDAEVIVVHNDHVHEYSLPDSE